MTLSPARYQVTQPEPAAALELLRRDRAWAAYGLGYLDRRSEAEVRLLSAQVEGNPVSLLVMARANELNTVFCTGDVAGLMEIIRGGANLPASGVFSAQPAMARALEQQLQVSSSYQMTRMRVDTGTLVPRRNASTRRLGVADLDAVKRLYGMWTDNQQLPSQLTRGIYYGVWHEGQLVAAAGTHVISPDHGVAAVGNVLTHSAYRNRGLASTTTTAVVQDLFDLGCVEVVLNVRHGNDAARRAYRRLGFVEHCEFVEGVFHNRARR